MNIEKIQDHLTIALQPVSACAVSRAAAQAATSRRDA